MGVYFSELCFVPQVSVCFSASTVLYFCCYGSDICLEISQCDATKFVILFMFALIIWGLLCFYINCRIIFSRFVNYIMVFTWRLC
jgi:hypothetical protein